MSRSQKQAVITFIEKKGKDRSFLDNWQPISLVNVDAKIMSKAIATRIKNVLPNIIHLYRPHKMSHTPRILSLGSLWTILSKFVDNQFDMN